MPRYKSRSARVAQTVQLRFLHKCGITLRPGGTPEINRWWNHRDSDPILSSPGGVTDRSQSVAPPGLGGSTGLVPVVTPPANLHRASGAKTCVVTLARQFALQLPDPAAFNHAASYDFNAEPRTLFVAKRDHLTSRPNR